MNGPAQPVAWRCENCRKWQPASIGSTILLVDEIGEGWSFAGAGMVKKRTRFMRRMVVCPVCRRAIADVPGEVHDEQSPASPARNERAETMEGDKP